MGEEEARAGVFSALSALGAFPFGFAFWLVGVLPVDKKVGETVVNVGVMMGAFLVVVVSMERRFGMALASGAFVVGALLAACAAPNAWVLLGCLFVMGSASGLGLAATGAYVAEIAPPECRGRLVSFVEAGAASGACCARALALLLEIFPGRHTWRVLVLIGALLSILLLWAIEIDDLLPPSPRFFLARVVTAKKRQGRNSNDETHEASFLSSSSSFFTKDQRLEWRQAMERLAISRPEDFLKEVQGAPKMISKRRVLTLAIFVVAARTLSGVDVILSDPLLRDRAGKVYANAAGLVFASARASTAFLVAKTSIFDKLGRIPIVLFSAAVTSLLLLVLALSLLFGLLHSRDVVVVFITLYAMAAEVGIFSGSWVLVSEILDTSMRLRGLGLAILIDAALFTFLQSPFVVQNIGGYEGLFSLFAASTFLVFIIFFFFLPRDTEGKTLEDITDHIDDLAEDETDYYDAVAEDTLDCLESAAYFAYDSVSDAAVVLLAPVTGHKKRPQSTTSATAAADDNNNASQAAAYYGSFDHETTTTESQKRPSSS